MPKTGRPRSNIISFEDAEREKKRIQNRQRYGDMIRLARNNKRYSQETLAKMVGVSPIAVTNWETGKTRPDLDNIKILCFHLGLTPNQFFDFESTEDTTARANASFLVELGRLPEHDQNVVRTLVRNMARAHDEEMYEQCKVDFGVWKRNGQSAAAGLTIPLSDLAYGDGIYLRKSYVPWGTDEIITVAGDSMMPVYKTGDEVFVHYTPELVRGDIGIFLVEGCGYIKEYQVDHLHSLNPAHPDIEVPCDGESFRIVGRVLGIVPNEALPSEEELIVLREIELDKRKS